MLFLKAFYSVKPIAIIIALLLSFSPLQPVKALTCRSYNHHSVCIVSIKRSAKYNWEYRASLKVDETVRPVEIYSCRDRVRIRHDGKIIPMAIDEAGDLVCRLLKRSS